MSGGRVSERSSQPSSRAACAGVTSTEASTYNADDSIAKAGTGNGGRGGDSDASTDSDNSAESGDSTTSSDKPAPVARPARPPAPATDTKTLSYDGLSSQIVAEQTTRQPGLPLLRQPSGTPRR